MIRRTLPLLLFVLLGAIFSAGLSTVAFAQEQEDDISVEDLVADGTLYLLSGDCELAQFYFQQALDKEPESPEALVGNGRALACRNNYPLAIESFQQAIEVDPDNSQAYVQLALAYQDQFLSDRERFPNRLSEALRTLEIAQEQDPNNPRVLNAKGVILFQMGSLQAAQTALEAAVDISAGQDSVMTSSERSVVLVNLGKTYRDLGNLELAQNAFRRAVMLDPDSSSAHNNLGNIHYRMGSCEDAEYELAQAAALDPDSLSAVSQLAIALFECGQVERSIRFFETAVELPGAIFSPPLYTYLARGYAQQGRYDDAVRRAQQGALLEPHTADAYFYLGEIYRARGEAGDGQAAQEAYQQALELDPQHQGAQEALAGLQ